MFPNSVDVVIDDRLEPDTVPIELGLSMNLSQMHQGLFMQLRRNKNQSTKTSDKVSEWSVEVVDFYHSICGHKTDDALSIMEEAAFTPKKLKGFMDA